MMRGTVLTILALALVSVGVASAQPTNDLEITDPAGDAGAAGVGLGSAGSDLDLLSADFETTSEGTYLTVRLASFDLQEAPATFYLVAWEVDGAFAFAGYANLVFPGPPFLHSAYGGCLDGGSSQGTCVDMPGERLADGKGFRMLLPEEWARPGATLVDPMAAVFVDPLAPMGSAPLWWEVVWPHNAADLAGPGRSYEVPPAPVESTEAAGALEVHAATAGSPREPDGGSASRPAALWAGAGLGLAGLGLVLRRR